MTKPVITVIGSINMDMVTVAEKIPAQGETILGERFETIPGGKGANQATAAARLGSVVQMIGRVGDDPFGQHLKDNLTREGVTQLCVDAVSHTSSGVATILITDNDNRIIVTPGANNEVTPEYVQLQKDFIKKSDVVLVQFEIPSETIEYTLDLCEELGIPVIVNPAPARTLPPEYWLKARYITPNESESQQLFGKNMLEQYPQLREKLIITRGKDGVTYTEDGLMRTLPAFLVDPVDTTGAGDTFNGALAVALAEDQPLEQAIRFANGAAALSIQGFGAQGGMPTREALEKFLSKHG